LVDTNKRISGSAYVGSTKISSSNPLKFLGFFVDSAMGTPAAADEGFFLVTSL
jgi:hypothetical protein